MATPLAQKEFEEFRKINGGKPVEGSLYYHYARLIEDLYAVEHARQLLEDPEITSKDIRSPGRITNHEGVGVIEAPRGTLWHHYWVDENGQLEKVNLIVATGNNNYAMSRAVEEVAKTVRPRRQRARRRPQPHRGGHPLLRPVPVLLDPRRRQDADGGGGVRQPRQGSTAGFAAVIVRDEWTEHGGTETRRNSSSWRAFLCVLVPWR